MILKAMVGKMVLLLRKKYFLRTLFFHMYYILFLHITCLLLTIYYVLYIISYWFIIITCLYTLYTTFTLENPPTTNDF